MADAVAVVGLFAFLMLVVLLMLSPSQAVDLFRSVAMTIGNDARTRARMEIIEDASAYLTRLPNGELLFFIILLSWAANGPENAMEDTTSGELRPFLELCFSEIMQGTSLPDANLGVMPAPHRTPRLRRRRRVQRDPQSHAQEPAE